MAGVGSVMDPLDNVVVCWNPEGARVEEADWPAHVLRPGVTETTGLVGSMLGISARVRVRDQLRTEDAISSSEGSGPG
jgi:hypothetical protein